jgi:CubicO group peptidase (beta-lactamase class C family)
VGDPMMCAWDRDMIVGAVERCKEAHGIPAMGMALYSTDGQCLQYHTGQAMSSRPVGEKTMFNIGSVGKPLVALAILQMIEQGHFALHDVIAPLLPPPLASAMPTRMQRITVEELLAHRSGLPFWGHFDSDSAYAHLLATVGRIEFIDKNSYPCKYSNLGYFLLGCIIERIAKVCVSKYLAGHLLDRLGMEEARFGSRSQLIQAGQCVVQGYSTARPMDFPTPDGKLLPAADWVLPPSISGLYTGTRDMLRWMQAFFHASDRFSDDAPMRSGIASILGTGWNRPSVRGLDLGMGMRRQRVLAQSAVTHLGYAFGYSAFIVMFPERGVAGAVMCNRGACQIPLAILLYSILAHCLHGKAITAKPRVPQIEATNYCGIYQNASDCVQVLPSGAGLALDYEGERVELRVLSQHHFMPSSVMACLPHFIFSGERAIKLRLGSLVYRRAGEHARFETGNALQHYTGTFFNPYFGEVVCYLDEGQLHLVQGVEDVLLEPAGADEFRLGEVAFFCGEKARFFFDQFGAVNACEIGGFEFVCS